MEEKKIDKKKISKIVGGAATAVLAVGSIGYTAYKVIKGEPPKYSMKWIERLSDNDWEAEREVVRQMMCNPEYDVDAREDFRRLLGLFDKVKSARDWAGKIPTGPGYHREHGYNLYKD